MPGRSFTTAWHNDPERLCGSRFWDFYALHIEREYELNYHAHQEYMVDHYRRWGSDCFEDLSDRLLRRFIEEHGIEIPGCLPGIVVPPYQGPELADIVKNLARVRYDRRLAQEYWDAAVRSAEAQANLNYVDPKTIKPPNP